jgi:hypothetical protein
MNTSKGTDQLYKKLVRVNYSIAKEVKKLV